MAHQVETMAYAGEVPWHGLGVKVEDNLTPDEMLVQAGLDWTVSKRHLYTHADPDVNASDDLLFVDKYSVLVRDSDNKTFGPVGPKFIPTQNKDAFKFFKKFTDAGNMKMDTAGSLKNGEQVWGLAKINDGFTLPGDDRVLGYLLLSVSHTWGKANEIRFTPIRVVCNNTLSYALGMKDTMGSFKMSHTQVFDNDLIYAAEQALGIADDQMSLYKEQAEFLSSKSYTQEKVVSYISELLQPDLLKQQSEMEKTTEIRAIANRQTMLDEFKMIPSLVHASLETQPGANMKSSKGTWWGAANAVTYVIDHKWGRDRDASLHNAWFGGRANLKNKAMDLAVEYAKAA